MTRRPQNPKTLHMSESDVLPTEHSPALVRQMTLIERLRRTVDQLAKDQPTRGDLKILCRALDELRRAFKVFRPYRRQRKVTVFGSARVRKDSPVYQQAVRFGRKMAEQGWMVVTGAGEGVMEAAHVGAGRKMSMGVNILLPFEQKANYVIANDKKLVNLRYFFTRKLIFVKEVHAIALFPGGFGTLDECFETLTLVQTGKRDLMPIVCVDAPNGTYWKAWLQFIREHLLRDGLISPEDLSLFKVTSDVDEAVHEILHFYSVYNSMRYVNERLVLRLHKEPSDEFVEELNRDFADLLERGRIEKTRVHRLEADDDHLRDLPRLALYFNRRSMGRLRQMVDRINDRLGNDENGNDSIAHYPRPTQSVARKERRRRRDGSAGG